MKGFLLATLLAMCSLAAVQAASQRLTVNKIQVKAAPQADLLQGPRRTEPQRFSGYFKLDRTYDASMFYFFFEAREDPDDKPLLIWMTGGPGCSSELAVFYENGPWSICDDLTLEETKYGWDNTHNVIYVDQPIGTGFSWSEDDRDRCYDETCVSEDMLDFLQAFYDAFPNFKGRDLFITGESYAGHYVPAVASRVFHAMKDGEAPGIKLAGLAIGNGLTDDVIQYNAYGDFAVENGLISNTTRDRMALTYPACKFALETCDSLDWGIECIVAVEFCQATQFGPILMANPGINVYDLRKDCEGDLCYDFSLMEEYLNQPSVRKELGVGDRVWEACSASVHQDMMADWGHSYDPVLPEMLAAGVRVMIYAGNKDIICNVLGNRRWVDALEWERSSEWATAEDNDWLVDGDIAGTVTEVGPLSFVTVFDAGHMVPMDKAREALEMITAFTTGKSLIKVEDKDGMTVSEAVAMSSIKGGKGVGGVALKVGRKEGLGASVEAS